MSFISFHFLAIVLCLFSLYYILPKKFQPYLLILGNVYFYYRNSGKMLILLIITSFVCYLSGLLLQSSDKNMLRLRKGILLFSVLIMLSPLFLLKYSGFTFQLLGIDFTHSFLIPMGISFYTLQLIGYLADIYRDELEAEKNFLRFFLFTSFFPQILQGPIPRYGALSETLFGEHDFNEEGISYGLQKILWGLFFKFMIASKAAFFVDQIFNSQEDLAGSLYLIAGILYSFQLYADFLSCVYLSQGIALLFGVKLSENFAQPYLASSIKDFWRRWHISLSLWLRDYVYIPLGGNRKGAARTGFNLLFTFFISGLWHGAGMKYIFWGLMHGFYQIIGKYTLSLRNRFYALLSPLDRVRPMIQRITTFFLVMTAWIIFRADSLVSGLHALHSVIFDFRPSALFHESLFLKRQNDSEFALLLLFIFFLLLWDFLNESKKDIIKETLQKSIGIRLAYSVFLLLIIAIFGTYGYGYDAATFIYGGF